MRVTIDTDRKVVEIDSLVNVKDLIDGLKALLGDKWKEYSIESKSGWYYPYYPNSPITYTTMYEHTTDNT